MQYCIVANRKIKCYCIKQQLGISIVAGMLRYNKHKMVVLLYSIT